MKIKIFILLIIQMAISQEDIIVYKNFTNNGSLDTMIDNLDKNIYLVQIDAKNDSLVDLALLALPELELFGGPASYHRLLNKNHIERLSKYLTNEYYRILDDNYKILESQSRDYWTLTLQGNQFYSTSGETDSSCMCIDGSDCVVVGFNDSWYDPLDYDGEVTWSFTPPYFDELIEARVTIAGVQCDNLPLWSETTMSIKNNDCNLGDFEATLGWDYTTNGPYVFTGDILNNIWCSGNLQPLIQSQDNYNVDWLRVELYYTCNLPLATESLSASDSDYCDYIEVNWDEAQNISEYKLYRDNQLIASLNSNQLQYSDYSAQDGVEYQYCLYSINQCGESNSVCNYGSRKSAPDIVESINASDEYVDFINITWSQSNEATFYNLYRDDFILSVIPQGNQLEYTDYFVEQEIIYEYCIESNNDCGSSTWNCDHGILSIVNQGDINMDQQIDVLDIVLLVSFILEIQIPTDDQEWLADLNLDGVINILDIVLLAGIVLNGN